MRVHHLLQALIVFATLNALCLGTGSAQNSADAYTRIQDKPSKIHWCLPETGNDPANIIESRCSVYRECLDELNLDEKVDQQPYPSLTEVQVAAIKRCHQALYNAARVNPQIKGSWATQNWLEHNVYPGTEAKTFPIPGVSSAPR